MARDVILVVDDEQGIRDQLYWALNDAYEVHVAADSAAALEMVRSLHPAVVTLDVALTGAGDEREGIDLVGRIVDIEPITKVIMITAHGQKENALECLQRGAYDFFSKPIALDELRVVIHRAIYLRHLEEENRRLQSELVSHDRFEGIVGTSDRIQSVFSFIRSVANTDYTILITGESGTGKELVARAIHRHSGRAGKPFIPINCGAIPENLLESELFGHERGAFTDAVARKIGKFEEANQGTAFLDEIGELSLKLQVKLLRFLEDRRIERIGGKGLIDLDVRILAATNRRLSEEAAAGRFREDLYYRLSVLHVDLPPLRERGEDLIVLANHFLTKLGEDNKRKGLRLSSEAIQAVDRYPWPGNVRELENRIRRAVILSPGSTITAADLGLEAAEETAPTPQTLQEVREHAEKEWLSKVLAAHQWNISGVSRQLQISRTTLYDLIEKYGLKKAPKPPA
ncbi:MAG TPA: PEP-CTERM-box response regulator transcription factor [Candidatus Deferrimicrobium sp.]|nr:PEP-CTERM-box response regulator transcription factor [Candidatus Deferrimicrobium sp.]